MGVGAVGGLHHTVNAAVDLMEEAAIPVQRQTHLKTDGVVLPINAFALEHLASDQTVLRHGDAIERDGCGHHGLGNIDLRVGVLEPRANHAAGPQAGALGRCQLRWRLASTLQGGASTQNRGGRNQQYKILSFHDQDSAVKPMRLT